VTKLDVSSLHSEVCGVAAFVLWSLALYGHFSHGISLNLMPKLNWLCSNVITSSLEELDISWPRGFTIIPENPSLGKFSTSLNFMLVIDAFLHKASLVSWV